MSDSASSTKLTVEFGPSQISAIDAWIARREGRELTREEAVYDLVVGRLGAEDDHPSTILPGFTTGRDIV